MFLLRKIFVLISIIIATSILGAGCRSTEKIPAGDVSIYKKFDAEIKIMQSKKSPDSKAKFDAAKTIFTNIDFTFIRTPQEVVSILGQDDARVIKANSNNYIQYRYRFNNDYILVRFLLVQNTLVAYKIKSNVVDD